MSFARTVVRHIVPLILACLALLPLPGCSIGYTNLRPGENSGLYKHLFDDVISRYDQPYWLWVRGSITGDLNGDGVVDEEVIIATIQQGDANNPGPIEIAFLAACKVAKDGNRTAIARQLLFDRDPIPRSPRPINDIGIVKDAPFTRCRAQMIADKVSLTETVVVYFWNDPLPTSVWYIGFALENGRLVKNLESLIWQTVPGILVANLDRSIEGSPLGYQLAFQVAAIPPELWKKIGQPSEMPLFGHVYARNSQGYYVQADSDARYRDNYHKLEAAWNQAYLKAALNGLPPEEMAWFEYHMGLLNYYTENYDMSRALLIKARRFAKDPSLLRAIDEAFVFTRFAPNASPETVKE